MRRVTSFKLGQIFRKFDIPYYFGKEETMSSHPLVQFVDSLERIKRYNYRAEDLLNLVKSGLYGGFTQEDLDLLNIMSILQISRGVTSSCLILRPIVVISMIWIVSMPCGHNW